MPTRCGWCGAASTSCRSTRSGSHPRAIKSQISRAKNQLEDAAAYRERVSSFFEQTAADVYELYEKRIHEMNAVDFDDLLFRTVNLLELFPDVAERYRNAFRWILVDEYQDTNHAQYRLLQLLAGEQRNVCVVGDDDQCLLEGTLVTMATAAESRSSSVRPGDLVMSCHGSGDFRPAPVTRTHRSCVTTLGLPSSHEMATGSSARRSTLTSLVTGETSRPNCT